MESPPSTAERPAGIEADIRTMVEAAQGPQPLANVYAGRAPFIPFQASLTATPSAHYSYSSTSAPTTMLSNMMAVRRVPQRYNPPAMESRPIFSLNEDSKPSASARMQPSAYASAETDFSDGEMPPLESIPREPLLPASLPPPLPEATPRSRKRKAMEIHRSLPAAKRPPKPGHDSSRARLKSDPDEKEDESGNCCICMCKPEPDELASIDGCEHQFCFECIEKWADRENTCPLCKNRFTKIERVNKKRHKGDAKSSKKVKNRDQRADMNAGSALENFFAGFLGGSGSFHPQIARLFLTGIGGASGVVELNSSASGGDQRAHLGTFGGWQRERHIDMLDTNIFDEDDNDIDSSLEDEGYGSFRARVRDPRDSRVAGPVMGTIPVFHAYQSQMNAHTATSLHTFTAAAQAAAASVASFPPPSSAAPYASAGRSYARNSHDVHAGDSAENALEIDDSDDEVEVVESPRL